MLFLAKRKIRDEILKKQQCALEKKEKKFEKKLKETRKKLKRVIDKRADL